MKWRRHKLAFLRALALAIFTLHTISGSAAVLVYGVTFWTGELVRIDLSTGGAATVTNIAPAYDIASDGGRLFTFHGSVVREFDPATGRMVSVRTFTNAVPGGEGAFTFLEPGIAYGTKSSNTTGTLFRLEFATTNLSLITSVGALSPSMDGLVYGPGGVLYGLQQNQGGDYGLYAVNTTTGGTSLIGRLGISFSSANGSVAGLAVSPEGLLYAVVGNQTESRLYRVEKGTGEASLVRVIDAPGLSGIAFATVPPGPLMIDRTVEGIRLSWPHIFGGSLESASELPGDWSPLAVPTTTNGMDATVLLEPSTSEAWFRLVLP